MPFISFRRANTVNHPSPVLLSTKKVPESGAIRWLSQPYFVIFAIFQSMYRLKNAAIIEMRLNACFVNFMSSVYLYL